MPTTSFYIGPGDGSVINSGSTWTTVRTAATGNAVNTSVTPDYVSVGYIGAANWEIYRMFLPVDCTALPDSATITSALLALHYTAVLKNDNDSQAYLSVVQTSQASPTTLSTADFDALTVDSATKGATDVNLSALTAPNTVGFSLNSTGMGWIEKVSGYTYLGIREGHDMENAEFRSDIGYGKYNYLEVDMSEATGTANDPSLTVTYTTASTFTPRGTIL